MRSDSTATSCRHWLKENLTWLRANVAGLEDVYAVRERLR